MREKFRQSMGWLHTWTGLILGWMLFAIFVTGTISYFRQEITYWMQPELHKSKPSGNEVEIALNRLQEKAPDAGRWSISLPGERSKTISVNWQNAERSAVVTGRPQQSEGTQNSERRFKGGEGTETPEGTKSGERRFRGGDGTGRPEGAQNYERRSRDSEKTERPEGAPRGQRQGKPVQESEQTFGKSENNEIVAVAAVAEPVIEQTMQNNLDTDSETVAPVQHERASEHVKGEGRGRWRESGDGETQEWDGKDGERRKRWRENTENGGIEDIATGFDNSSEHPPRPERKVTPDNVDAPAAPVKSERKKETTEAGTATKKAVGEIEKVEKKEFADDTKAKPAVAAIVVGENGRPGGQNGMKPAEGGNEQRQEGARPRGRTRGITEILDASTGEILKPRETMGGAFFYRFHFTLFGVPRQIGMEIIGLATLLMFAAIITGIIMHKRIFVDFFTFRKDKGLRSWLDAHIFTAVLALPYHIMITYSGLLLLMGVLIPWNSEGHRHGHEEEKAGFEKVEKIDMPEIQPIKQQAEKILGAKAGRLEIQNPGKSNMVITFSPEKNKNISEQSGGGGTGSQKVVFNAQGELSSMPGKDGTKSAQGLLNIFSSLHRAKFADPFMRWLFFISGAFGSVMVATGMVIWERKKSSAAKKGFGRRLVEVLNVGGITGLVGATAVYLWANRLIPAAAEGRSDLEIYVFFAAWAALAVHPVFRPQKKAWIEQLWACAVLYALLPVLNALTSSVNIFSAIASGNGILAGVDLTVLMLGVSFGYAAFKTMKSGREVTA